MAKIIRKTQYLFAENSPPNSVSAFGSIDAGSPSYSLDPAILQNEPEWGQGWTSAQYEGVRAPYIFDRNAVDLVAFYQLAYILQEGIAEWDAGTTYYTNSIVQYGGNIYKSLQDNNLGNTPPTNSSNSFWNLGIRANNLMPTRTVLTSGSGTYTPPTGCVRIYFRMVGGGGGGGGGYNGGNGGDGGNTTLGSYTANGGGGGAGGGVTTGGGYGGTSTFGSFNVNGEDGAPAPSAITGGSGGSSVFGGAGSGGSVSDGQPASNNSGAGGGGGGADSTLGGGGGGAGGYGELQIVNPTSMSYSVGAGGGGGIGGPYNGGNGGSGVIIIDEFYY